MKGPREFTGIIEGYDDYLSIYPHIPNWYFFLLLTIDIVLKEAVEYDQQPSVSLLLTVAYLILLLYL